MCNKIYQFTEGTIMSNIADGTQNNSTEPNISSLLLTFKFPNPVQYIAIYVRSSSNDLVVNNCLEHLYC